MPLEILPPELRDNPSLKDFNDPAALAKSYLETKQHVGNSIRPPAPEASPEARAEFIEKLKRHAPELVYMKPGDETAEAAVWEKLGRPKDEAGYEFKPPEGVDIDIAPLRAAAKAAGLTKAQFEKLAGTAVTGRQKELEAIQAERASLKQEWGAAYDEKLASAAAAASKLGLPEDVIASIKAGTMRAPQLKTWAAIAKSLGTEGTEMARQGTQQGTGKLTPAEAMERTEEIRKNPAYWDSRAPEHEQLRKKMLEYMQMAYPE